MQIKDFSESPRAPYSGIRRPYHGWCTWSGLL